MIVGCIVESSVIQTTIKVAHDLINPPWDSYLLTRVHDYHGQVIIDARDWPLIWITDDASCLSNVVVIGTPVLKQIRPRLGPSNLTECGPEWGPKRSLSQEGPC